MDYAYELKIPRERVAVLIGKSGKTKSDLEKATKTKLDIDSVEGEIKISGNDPLQLFTCREIVRAIARGFNPESAMKLLKQDMALEIMGVEQYAGEKDLGRIRGRVIGEGGKARRIIEELTECNVSVYGKTVSIIGDFEGMNIARRAIESLLGGSQHATVYKWLERQRRELKRRRAEI
jgi:ribosomal RNA assembly protein